MGTSELSALMKCWAEGGRSIANDWNPIQGGVVLLLIPSCYGNQAPSLDGPRRGGYCKGLASYPGESSITPSCFIPWEPG